ncbi:hypothetical protein NAU58_18120 [Pseudomonas stutzeri]|uniref:Uncharacterized protein n=1 Tax=Stutzerimonas stutzeri TaxID=316 RepID=A0A2N8RZ17_STUST|nr:hypothetical protein [Stutzerimonas stutzeri]MCQ4297498.1 hypothetical protein [Stutzerimonas stutzeri]PNF79635.1 hypothetical protein CXK92_13380 [Stutzerimonas stutzeri]
MLIDMQSAIVAEVIARLGVVPSFGGLVFEDSVLRILDSDDETLPDDFIVIQPGQTVEVERAGSGSVRERVTLNVTAITRRRGFAPALRAARLAIKVALPGTKAGLTTQGVQTASFQTETPMPPGEGRRWACHVLPLQITYLQPLK